MNNSNVESGACKRLYLNHIKKQKRLFVFNSKDNKCEKCCIREETWLKSLIRLLKKC